MEYINFDNIDFDTYSVESTKPYIINIQLCSGASIEVKMDSYSTWCFLHDFKDRKLLFLGNKVINPEFVESIELVRSEEDARDSRETFN